MGTCEAGAIGLLQPLTAIALPTMNNVPYEGGATFGGGAKGVTT